MFTARVEWLRRHDVELPQDPGEFVPFLSHVNALQPRVLMEVGTREGGALFMLAHAMRHGGTVISVDLPGGPWGHAESAAKKAIVTGELATRGFEVHAFDRDSQRPETRQEVDAALRGRAVDVLFLDADHSFEGVSRDWELYSPLVRPGGIVAFHDLILSDAFPQCGVGRLWEALKRRYPTQEYWAAYGLGILTLG